MFKYVNEEISNDDVFHRVLIDNENTLVASLSYPFLSEFKGVHFEENAC